MNVLYAQLVGAAAMLTITFAVQCRKKKHMMIVQMFAHLLYAFQYTLLGAFSACYMDLMAVLRTLIFYKYDKSRKKIPVILPIIICVITSLIGYFTYTNTLSLIPVIIAIAYTIGASFKNPRVYKYVFAVCAFGWIYYNFKVSAYICIIGNVCEITSSAIAIIRETKIKKQKENKKKKSNHK